jgi:hypothetical protein
MFQRRCGDDQVIKPDHLSTHHEVSPNPRVYLSCLLCVRDDGKRRKRGFKVPLTFCSLEPSSSFDTMPNFCNRDCCDLELVVRTRRHPSVEIECLLLTSNDYTSASTIIAICHAEALTLYVQFLYREPRPELPPDSS